MLYLFIVALLIIPISEAIYVIWCFKHFDYKQYKLYEKETIRPYTKLDSRKETLIHLCNEEKSIAEYYALEKGIRFP